MSRKVKEGETLAVRTTDDVLDTNTHKESRRAKRNDKLTEELMYGKSAYKRTARDTVIERDTRYARLHSFAGSTDVQMRWDINDACIRDQVFEMKIGDQKAFISAVELQKYLRWV